MTRDARQREKERERTQHSSSQNRGSLDTESLRTIKFFSLSLIANMDNANEKEKKKKINHGKKNLERKQPIYTDERPERLA